MVRNNFFLSRTPYFCLRKKEIMQQEYKEVIDNTHKDFTHNWVSSSRFIWFCQVFVIIAFVLGGCYSLYTHRYKGKPEVNVPENTLYNPKYK